MVSRVLRGVGIDRVSLVKILVLLVTVTITWDYNKIRFASFSLRPAYLFLMLLLSFSNLPYCCKEIFQMITRKRIFFTASVFLILFLNIVYSYAPFRALMYLPWLGLNLFLPWLFRFLHRRQYFDYLFLAGCVAISILVNGSVGWLQYLTYRFSGISLWGLEHHASDIRLSGFSEFANFYSLQMVSWLSIVYKEYEKNWIFKFAWCVGLSVVVLTCSKLGWLLVLLQFFWIFSLTFTANIQDRRNQAKKLALMVLIIFLTFFVDRTFMKFHSPEHTAEEKYTSYLVDSYRLAGDPVSLRLRGAEQGLGSFLKNPVVGVGLRSYDVYRKEKIEDSVALENGYVELLAEGGILVFLIVCSILGIYLYQLKDSISSAGIWLYFLVGLQFVQTLMNVYGFWTLAILSCSGASSGRNRHTARQRE